LNFFEIFFIFHRNQQKTSNKATTLTKVLQWQNFYFD
jgi:hypothetical protein